jgi:hypothetical protein
MNITQRGCVATTKGEMQARGQMYYKRLYEADVNGQAEWLQLTCTQKTDAIERLLRRNCIHPKVLMEIGCGTGAVIGGCASRQLAREYIAIDPSPEAIEVLRVSFPMIKSYIGDAATAATVAPPCDVIVLSHVIEHFDDPESVLHALATARPNAEFIFEVPLEDLWASRLKNRFRNRTLNTAGHVQFFTPRSFGNLLRASGFRIVDKLLYAPVLSREALRVGCSKDDIHGWHFAVKIATSDWLPRVFGALWTRFYYGHLAVLCQADSRTDSAGLRT